MGDERLRSWAKIMAEHSALSNDELFDNFSMHVSEPEVTACIPESKVLVVKAEKVKHRCVQVVNMHGLFDGLVAKLVGGAVNVASLHAAAREPHRETVGVVVPAGSFAISAFG